MKKTTLGVMANSTELELFLYEVRNAETRMLQLWIISLMHNYVEGSEEMLMAGLTRLERVKVYVAELERRGAGSPELPQVTQPQQEDSCAVSFR